TISEILAISTLYYLPCRIARQNSHQNQSKHIIWAIQVMSNLARNLKRRPGTSGRAAADRLGEIGEELISQFLGGAGDQTLAELGKLAADLRLDIISQERAAVLVGQSDRRAAL